MESPLVALISSSATDSRINSRGFSSIANLLAPFTTHQIEIRDPSTGQHVTSKVTIDIRDIQKQGHLLSLSVLPFVLSEALSSKKSLDESLRRYQECLSKWAEPTDQETFRSYLACIFVVSGCEENPMSELSRLIQLQHTLQHTTDVRSISPAHCATPKWTTFSTLKHYILLHDSARDDENRSAETFEQMCNTYGNEQCQMLKIGVGPSDGLPNAWLSIDEDEQLLELGLSKALESASSSKAADELKPGGITSVSTISPSYAVVTSHLNNSFVSSPSNGAFSNLSSTRHLASSTDRENCGRIVEKFLKTCLVPHCERLMRTLNDQLADRRGIGKSLTSGMKKWFGSGSSLQNAASTATYGAESAEMKSRRLADIAFLFGIYSLAYAQYHSVKKDFENDQAWLCHASVLEMTAVAFKLSPSCPTAKAFPFYYMEKALNYQLTYGGKHHSIMRCVFNCSRIMSEFGMNKEAAIMLSQNVASFNGDQNVGIVQAIAATHFEEANLIRKAAFYRILAGNRFTLANIRSAYLECYKTALPEYYDKQWDSIEDHLCSALCTELEGDVACQCASRLLQDSEHRSEVKQNDYIDKFIATLKRECVANDTFVLPIPILVSDTVNVICGDRPLLADVPTEEGVNWEELERAAFHSLAGASSSFRRVQLVSDLETDNTKVKETPSLEKYRVCFVIRNPLVTTLSLRNIRLGATDTRYRDGVPLDSVPFSEVYVLQEVILSPYESRLIELWVCPSENIEFFRVESLLLDLVDSTGNIFSGKLMFNIKGKRLNRSAKEMKSILYATDNRLSSTVATSRWPLLDFRSQKLNQQHIFGNQYVRLCFEVENIGSEIVSELSIATNGMDNVCVSLERSRLPSDALPGAISVNNNQVRVFTYRENIVAGNTHRIVMNIRAPDPHHSRTIGILFYYRGSNGVFREWRSAYSLDATPLINAKASVIDSSSGLVALSLSNIVASSTAALARVEILRVRSVYQCATEFGDWEQQDSEIEIGSSKIRQVVLDSEQSDTICFTMVASGRSIPLWLCNPVEAPQCIPPRPDLNDELPLVRNRLLAILWKASVVDNDGHVASSIYGENFAPCPLFSGNIPATTSSVVEASDFPLLIYVHHVPPIEHNFATHRHCRIPLAITIANKDKNYRTVVATVKFIPRVREPVALVQHIAPDSRQIWWPDRSVAKAFIDCGEKHTFSFSVNVLQPSVYELGGSQMSIEACFDDDSEPVSLPVPSLLAIVNGKL